MMNISNILHRRFRSVHSQPNLKARYDAVSTTWDKTLHKLRMPQVYAHLWHDMYRRELLSRQPKRVLDIGMGTGALVQALLNTGAEIQEVNGIDISSQMLVIAQQNLASYEGRFKLYQQDVSKWNAPHNHYDLIMSAHTLEHVSEPKAVIEQVYCSLRDGGSFLLVITRESLWGQYIRYQWHDVYPTTASTARTWLEHVGFREIEWLPLRGNFISGYGSLALIARKPRK